MLDWTRQRDAAVSQITAASTVKKREISEGGGVQIDFAEQRRHYRVYFSGDGEFTCTIRDKRGDNQVNVDILDLSLGGVHIALNDHRLFEVGDFLEMSQCQFQQAFAHEEMIELEVRWFFVSEEFQHVHLGCQFRELSLEMHDYLAKVIENKSRLCNQLLKEKIA